MERKRTGTICSVVGCRNTYSTKPGLRLFSFPAASRDAGRRRLWVQALKRETKDGLPWQPTIHDKVCSDHFVGGAPVYHPLSPSYVPTIFPGAYRKKPPSSNAQKRFERSQKRRQRIEQLAASSAINEDIVPKKQRLSMSFLSEVVVEEDTGPTFRQIGTQTDKIEETSTRETNFVFQCQHYGADVEVQACISEQSFDEACTQTEDEPELKSVICGPSTKKVCFTGYRCIRDDNNACKDLCGVSLEVFAELLSVLKRKTCRKLELRLEDKLVLYLMKQKLGLSYSALGVIFSLHPCTASRIFHHVGKVLRSDALANGSSKNSEDCAEVFQCDLSILPCDI